MYLKSRQKQSGFTLIELLVVVTIISVLSSVVISQTRTSRLKAYDSVRISNLRELRNILELYYEDYGYYPKTYEVGFPPVARMECVGNPNDYIPDVVPDYIGKLPSDPNLNCAGIPHSWVYRSNGIDYKLITHNEWFHDGAFMDPAYDNGVDDCIIDGPSAVHIGVWTSGAACWKQ